MGPGPGSSGRKRLSFHGRRFICTVFLPRQTTPFRSPVDESKKSTVRFFMVLILLKATMRFEEGYGHLRRWHSTPTRQFTSQLPRLGFQQRP
jgi:hypothetical protein